MLGALFQLSLWTIGRLPDPAIRGLTRALFGRSWRSFEAATEHPRETQLARLQLILDRAKETAFGKEHGFAGIRTFEEFRRRVPIRSYDELAPYIERMLTGEANVLTPDPPLFFARTSGTTGTPKSIPVTAAYVGEYRVPRRVWSRQVAQAFPGLVRGKILSMHSPRIEGRTDGGVQFGSITVPMGGSPGSQEFPVSRFGLDASPRSLFLLDDFELKYYFALRLAAQEDVRLCASINPSTLVLLAKKLDQYADRIAEDLQRGGAADLARLPDPIKSAVAARLRPNRAAAERIRRAKSSGRVRPTDLWPEIAGLVCWKGGSAPFYLAQLEDWFPGKRAMDYGYLATEGGFSFPLSPDAKGGVLAVLGHVLELVPEEARARGESEPGLLADELEIGRRYRVIITGSHGLYRYDINDVVECVGRYRNTAEVAFVHKGGNMLSLTGEKVGERHVVEAFARAAAQTQLPLVGFSVSIELGDPPRYLFGVEPERGLELAEQRALLDAAEAALREVNIEYAAKRDSLRLGAPKLLILAAGAYERHRRGKVEGGAPDSHVKSPHLFRERRDLEALGVVAELER